MKPFRPKSAVEQLAAHLREEIRSGALGGQMPGVAQLVRRLGVGTKTVVAAIDKLKREGLLEGEGVRVRRQIVAGGGGVKAGLRVRILLYEDSDKHDEYIVRLGFQLQERGHQVEYAPKTLTDLHFDVKRVARMVEKSDAGAWVVRSGSRPVLEWFAAQRTPAFAMFGRQTGLPIASLTNVKSPAMVEALRRLVDLGHSRIVMLAREERRKPTPGLMERQFLAELERLGVDTGAYNLPDWEDEPQGLHHCLESLFRHTPPTALMASEPSLIFATQHYLNGKGVVVPRDVSLVAMDDHPAYEWFVPQISRIHTETRHWVPRVVQWVENVAKGKDDRRETLIESEFIKGGTIGPAPGRRGLKIEY